MEKVLKPRKFSQFIRNKLDNCILLSIFVKLKLVTVLLLDINHAFLRKFIRQQN